MSYSTSRLRRTAARLPRGTLMTLVTLGMLVLTIGAARAADAASRHSAFGAYAATSGVNFAAIVGARVGEALRSARVRSFDLTNCEPVDEVETVPAATLRNMQAPVTRHSREADR